MKRIINIAVAVSLFILPFVSCTHKMSAQASLSNDAIKKDVAGDEVAVNNVNGKILRNFYIDFGEKNDAKWYKSATGYRVTFNADDMLTRVYYKSGGTQECIIRYYFEKQLKKDVRHRVKSDFYDYAITHITEVTIGGATAYHIKLESQNEVKTVKLTDDSMEVTETLIKLNR